MAGWIWSWGSGFLCPFSYYPHASSCLPGSLLSSWNRPTIRSGVWTIAERVVTTSLPTKAGNASRRKGRQVWRWDKCCDIPRSQTRWSSGHTPGRTPWWRQYSGTSGPVRRYREQSSTAKKRKEEKKNQTLKVWGGVVRVIEASQLSPLPLGDRLACGVGGAKDVLEWRTHTHVAEQDDTEENTDHALLQLLITKNSQSS